MFRRLREDIRAIRSRDPAARSTLTILFCYPSLHALAFYRMANACWRARFFFLGRYISALGRWLTGIEIHPGATIGRGLFIDHGMGVVIGETAEIGEDVTLYHGVTLGGVAPSVDSASQRGVKRHPTLGDGVIVGSGAQILGPIVVGENARIGANAVVTKDVAPGTTMVGIPARAVVREKACKDSFAPYGTPLGDLPDPAARAIQGLMDQVTALSARVQELEHAARDRVPMSGASGQDGEAAAKVPPC
ncbi:MAG: serine O-acetyltransferase EpsC [Alphaproteobacteria bacterium]